MSGFKTAGTYEVTFNGSDLSSGIIFTKYRHQDSHPPKDAAYQVTFGNITNL